VNEAELLATIEEAARLGLTRLDLSFKGITGIPTAMSQLTSLTSLR